MLTHVVIEDASGLRALSAEWASLLERSAANEITCHPEWMLGWWDVFGSEGARSVRAIAFYEGAMLVGLAPLLARPFTYRPRLPFRRLELLASGEDEADETCSQYLGLIAARGSEDAVATAFATALVALETWDELVLTGLNGESPLVSTLAGALSRQRLRVSVEESDRAPYVKLPRSFEAYLGSVDPARRTELAALEAWCGEPPRLERARTHDDLAQSRRILEALHRERHPDGGLYRSARFRAFHDRVTPRLLDLGALDLGWLSVRGEPVAAFYNLRWNERTWHYQSAHKLDVPAAVRIGVTLQTLLLRSAIEDGMREYDFLAGVLDYKTALAKTTRRLVTLRAARPSLAETARAATALARRMRALFR